MRTIQAYRRANGEIGIRNRILILSLVQCANGAVNKIASICDVPAITIDTGCGEYHDQEHRTNLGLIRAGQNPNVYGVVLVSLGCQWTDPAAIGSEIEKCGKKVYHICIQDIGGVQSAVEKGVELVRQMQAEAAALKREEFPISMLKFSVYCGGSDWSSSVAANVVTGECADKLGDQGAAFATASLRGAPGNEQHLIDLAADYTIGERILNAVEEYRNDVFQMTGQSIADVNPTPGNKAFGITTLCEKAIGNLKLSGNRTPINGVLEVGDPLPGPGQWFIDNRQGGNDVYATTTLAMAGTHLCLFTTGRGTPLGTPTAVTVKITGNADTYRRLGAEMIDFDASPIITEGASVDQLSDELLDLVVEIANGAPAKSELLADYSWATPPFGKI